jgi:hypothetical protein
MLSRQNKDVKEVGTDSKQRYTYSDMALSTSNSFSEVGQITVTARLRSTVTNSRNHLSISADPNESTIFISRSDDEPMSLRFNHAFGPEASQAHIYRKSFAQLAEGLFKG